MLKLNLYRIVKENKVIDTLNEPSDSKYVLRYRLVAEENKVLTDGSQTVAVIDIDKEDLDKWTEVNEPLDVENEQ